MLSDRVAVLEDLRPGGVGIGSGHGLDRQDLARWPRRRACGPSLPHPVVEPPAGVRGSLQIRHVDAGSCNGCEVEISGAFGPVYDAERFGARLVASPAACRCVAGDRGGDPQHG